MTRESFIQAPVGINSFDKVSTWLNIAGIPRGQLDRLPQLNLLRSYRLIKEEYEELSDAIARFLGAPTLENLVPLADALIDLEVVIHNMTHDLGLPYLKLFNEVHRSNLEKFTTCGACKGSGCQECKETGVVAIKNEHGKIQKPEGWKPPNLMRILMKAMWEAAEARKVNEGAQK